MTAPNWFGATTDTSMALKATLRISVAPAPLPVDAAAASSGLDRGFGTNPQSKTLKNNILEHGFASDAGSKELRDVLPPGTHCVSVSWLEREHCRHLKHEGASTRPSAGGAMRIPRIAGARLHRRLLYHNTMLQHHRPSGAHYVSVEWLERDIDLNAASRARKGVFDNQSLALPDLNGDGRFMLHLARMDEKNVIVGDLLGEGGFGTVNRLTMKDSARQRVVDEYTDGAGLVVKQAKASSPMRLFRQACRFVGAVPTSFGFLAPAFPCIMWREGR